GGWACPTLCSRASTEAVMDLFNNLIFGFGVALSLQNLLYCLIGVTVGTLIGVLPGIGPLGTIAILMPITYGVEPVGALIMRAGIFAGRKAGGPALRHAGDPAGRALGGGPVHRRLPDGAGGPRRAGAGDRRHRLVLRRHRGHAINCAIWSPTCGRRAQVRLAR